MYHVNPKLADDRDGEETKSNCSHSWGGTAPRMNEDWGSWFPTHAAMELRHGWGALVLCLTIFTAVPSAARQDDKRQAHQALSVWTCGWGEESR